jgi:hypothetical protein
VPHTNKQTNTKMKHSKLITAAVLGLLSASTISTQAAASGTIAPAEKEGCKGKDGCKGEKKDEKKDGTFASMTPAEKEGCKGKDGCKGEKKEEKKDGAIL